MMHGVFEQVPSTVPGDRILIFALTPHGSGTMVPLRESLTETHNAVTKLIAEMRGSDPALAVANDIAALLQSVDDEEAAREKIGDIASLVSWLAWHDAAKRDASVEHIEWIVFGLVDNELVMVSGDTDAAYLSARDSLMTLHYASQGKTIH